MGVRVAVTMMMILVVIVMMMIMPMPMPVFMVIFMVVDFKFIGVSASACFTHNIFLISSYFVTILVRFWAGANWG
jgi:hypothetical protein